MHTVHHPAVKTADPPLPPLNITPEWIAEVEYWAALRGLPPDPWPQRP